MQNGEPSHLNASKGDHKERWLGFESAINTEGGVRHETKTVDEELH